MDLLDSIMTNMEKSMPLKPSKPRAPIQRPIPRPSVETAAKKPKVEEDTKLGVPSEMVVTTNFFNVNYDGPGHVERLHLDILATTKKGKCLEVNGEKKGYGDIGGLNRRFALWAIWRSFLELQNRPFVADTETIYDCGSAVYVMPGHCTMILGEKKTFRLNPDQLNERAHTILTQQIDFIEIKMVRDTDVLLKGFRGDDPVAVPEAVRFFEVLTSQQAFGRNYLHYGGKIFASDRDGIKGLKFPEEGKEIKTGFLKAVKYIGNVAEPRPAVCLDVKRSPFYTGQSLIDLLMKLLCCRRPMDLANVLRDRKAKSAIDEVKTLAVQTTHLPRQALFYIHSIDKKSAKEVVFEIGEDKSKLSVADYYLKKHRLRLQYPDLPLVVRRSAQGSTSYFPLELLYVENGQRVKPDKISSKMHQELPQKLKLRPDEHIEQYKTIHTQMNWNSQLMRHFKVSISPDPITVSANRFQAPLLNFGGPNRFEPDMDNPTFVIKSTGRKFLKPAKDLKITLILMEDVYEELKHFENKLRSCCQNVGMTVTEIKVVRVKPNDFVDLDKQLKNSTGNLILCITKEKKDESHDDIKLSEAKNSKQTLHICLDTARKFMVNSNNGKITVQNVLSKLNVKGGGVNFVVEPPRLKSGRTLSPTLQSQLFNDTMVIGFDMSHARSQCLFDRQFKVAVGEPTFVGMSFSLNNTTDHAGQFWAQKPRQMNIGLLDAKIPEALKIYNTKTKKWPKTLIIYRSGVGEGAFKDVEQEIVTIRQAALKTCGVEVKVVAVVVQADSSYRMFNTKEKGKNIPAGTSIVKGVVNCQFNEFVLMAHVGRLGTSRPVRYTILVNDLDLVTSDVAQYTYWNCFGHQVNCSPVSAPDVIFSATNIAKRARNNFLTVKRNTAIGSDSGGRDDLVPLEDAKVFEDITNSIKSFNMTHNFWQ